MKQLLNDIGIKKEGYYGKNNAYIIDIEDSDEYGKFYTLLDRSKIIYELEDNTLLTIHSASVSYANEKFQLNLLADFDEDLYKLVVREIK